MAPELLIQPMRVATRSADEDGRLVLADGRLVAILVRLADAAHAGMAGSWFLEIGFGPCTTATHPVFRDLDAAQDWICRQVLAEA